MKPRVTEPSTASPDPGDHRPSVPDAKGMKKLSKGEERALTKSGNHPHELKPKIGGSEFNLYKDRRGNIYVVGQGGKGLPEPTNLRINGLKVTQQ